MAVEGVVHLLPATFARGSDGGPDVAIVDLFPVMLPTRWQFWFRMFTGFRGFDVLLRWVVLPGTVWIVNGVGGPVSSLGVGTSSPLCR